MDEAALVFFGGVRGSINLQLEGAPKTRSCADYGECMVLFVHCHTSI